MIPVIALTLEAHCEERGGEGVEIVNTQLGRCCKVWSSQLSLAGRVLSTSVYIATILPIIRLINYDFNW